MALSALLLLSFLSLLSSTQAGTKDWLAMNGQWDVDANWYPSGVPGSDDDVTITSDQDIIVTLNNQATIRTLTLGGTSGKQTLLLSGAILSISNGGSVSQAGVLEVVSGTIEGSGTLVVDGVATFKEESTKTIATITIDINGNMTLDGGGIELQDAAILQISQGGMLTVTSKDGIVNSDKTDAVLLNQGTVISNSGISQDFTSTFSSVINNEGLLIVEQGTLLINNRGNWPGELQVASGCYIQVLSGNHTFGADSVVSGNGTFTVANSAAVDLMGEVNIKAFVVNGGGAVVSVHATNDVTFDQLTLKNGELVGDKASVSELDWEGGSLSLKDIEVDNLHVVGTLARTITGSRLAIVESAFFADATNVLLYEAATVIISEGATMVLDRQVYFLCGINDTTSTVQVEGEVYVNFTGGIEVTCSLQVESTGVVSVTSSLSVQAPFILHGALYVANNSHVDFSVGGPAYVGSKIYGAGQLSCFACDLTVQGFVDIGGIVFTGGSILFQLEDATAPYLPHIRYFNQSGSSVLQLINNAEVGLNLTIDILEFTGGQIKSNLNSLFGIYSSLVITEEAKFYGGSPVIMQDLSVVNYGETTFAGSQPAEMFGRNTFVNADQGIWIIDGQVTFSQSDQQSGFSSVFNNYGVVEIEVDSKAVFALNFNNYGGVSVREKATLTFQQSVYIQQDSSYSETVLFGGTLSSATPINIITGRLMGYGTVESDVLLKGAIIATTQISGGTVSNDTPLKITGSLVQRSPGALGVALASDNGTTVVTGLLVVENTYQLWGGSLIIQPLEELALPDAPLVFATFANKIGNDYDVILNANINTTYGYSVTVGSTAQLSLVNNPVVTSITPATGPTNGATLVTISGSDFAQTDTVQVLFGDKVANVSSWNGNDVVVLSPAGTGKNLLVCIVVNYRGCASTSDQQVGWNYHPPTIDSLSVPNNNSRPTAGGNTVIIKGSNFGADASVASVLVGNATCTITNITHESIECTTPPGVGASNSLTVTIDGQEAGSAYSYDGPTVWSTSPSSIHTHGGERVLVIGSNFGTTLSSLDVTIDSHPCTNLTLTQLEEHTAISCTAPTLRAGTLDLVVTVAGQKSPASKLTVTNQDGGSNDTPSVWDQPWWAYFVACIILVVLFILGFVAHSFWMRRRGYERVNDP